MDDVNERPLMLAKRELSADDVRLLAPGEAPPDAANVVVARLRDGRHVVASFGSARKDVDVLSRRLAMLAGTFADALDNLPEGRTKPRLPVGRSLHEARCCRGRCRRSRRHTSRKAAAARRVRAAVDAPALFSSPPSNAQLTVRTCAHA